MGQTVNSGSSTGHTSSACMQPRLRGSAKMRNLPPKLAKTSRLLRF